MSKKTVSYIDRFTREEALIICQANLVRKEMLHLVNDGEYSTKVLAKKYETTERAMYSLAYKPEHEICNHRLYEKSKTDIEKHFSLRLDIDKVRVAQLGKIFGTKTNTPRAIKTLMPLFDSASNDEKVQARQAVIKRFNLKAIR